MRCSKCQKETNIFITSVNMATMQPEYLCDACLIENSSDATNLDSLDKEIDDIKSMLDGFMPLVRKYYEQNSKHDASDLPAGFFTPPRALDMAKGMYNVSLKKRQKLLESLSEMERLIYLLKRAVGTEDFEQAGQLRDRIEKLKSHKE